MAFGGGSLVSNILQKSSSFDDRVIEDGIQKLTKKSNQLKGEIYELLKQNYTEFQSYVDSTLALDQKIREVTSEYRRLSGRVEQELKGRIHKTSDKRKEFDSKLHETHEQIAFLQSLLSAYQDLEASRSDLRSDRFGSAAGRLNKTAECLGEIEKAGCNAKVFSALKSELAFVTSELVQKLQEEWGQFVVWNPKLVPDNPTLATLLTVELRMPMRSGSLLSRLDEVVTAMKLLVHEGVWARKAESFGKKLLQFLVKPLIMNHGVKVVRSKEKNVVVLRLMKTDETLSPDRHVVALYSHLLTAFAVARQVVPQVHQVEWTLRVGEEVRSDMADLIIRSCLAASIPKSPSELEDYVEISAKTAEFEASLCTGGICDQDFHPLSDYTQNVSTHFADQKCQDLLVRARSVLMKPIHNTVSITNAEVSQLGVGVSPTKQEAYQLKSPNEGVDLNSLTFAFPPCIISKSTKEFVELLYDTLKECCTSATPLTAIQLFHTARNMVELFCAVLPSHHRSEIAEVPRIAAVQHNNCFYLAHHLITLGHQFHRKLPAPLNSELATFIDQVPFVRQLGEECFLVEMRKQCGFIVEGVKSLGGFNNVSSDNKCEVVRKRIQQSLLKVTTLSQAYTEVLPTEIHRKAVGALLNSLVTEVVKGVLALEDIAVDDTTELVGIVRLIVEKGPLVLLLSSEEAENTSTYCSSWGKLRELGTVLDASLQDIVDLWDYGSGPLAQHFTGVELRALIKALFQNTERRATALSKITL